MSHSDERIVRLEAVKVLVDARRHILAHIGNAFSGKGSDNGDWLAIRLLEGMAEVVNVEALLWP
jgi:hypothetical protein